MPDERERYPGFEDGQDIRDRAFEFACSAVMYCEKLLARGGVGRVMVPQIVHASTAVPSMLEEARAAESRRDFISKCSIGLKEAREAWVRLRICWKVERGDTRDVQQLVAEAEQIVKILGAIIRNTRANSGISYR